MHGEVAVTAGLGQNSCRNQHPPVPSWEATEANRAWEVLKGTGAGVTQGLAGATRLYQHLLNWDKRTGMYAHMHGGHRKERGGQDSVPGVI